MELSKKRRFLFGAVSGLVSDSFAHPLDTVRARMIMQRRVAKFNYTGVFNAIKTIARNEGVRGFYKGFLPVMLFTVPAHGLYFFSYEESKKKLYEALNLKKDSFLVNISAGLIADLFGSICWVPMEVCKQNAMINPEKSQLQIVKEIYLTQGFRGFFRGYFACILTFAPYVMLNFGFYEKIKIFQGKLLKCKPDDLPKVCFFAGAVASSVVSSFFTTPLSVGRTRIQCDPTTDSNLIKEVYKILTEEGFKPLMEVWRARALWFALGTAISFGTFEYLKSSYKKKKEDDI